MEKIVNITESAEEYLAKLLQDKNEPNLAVRIFISDPGTPKAETCLAYCKPEEAMKDDEILNLNSLKVHIEKRSIPFLVDAEVNYDNDTEINPMLESHGGEVSLLEFTDKGEAILQFGGGCQGCGMVDVTLKDGIEKTLLEQIPELKSVKDSTDHSLDDNAYYKT